jgi:hypothetical protein
VKRISIEMNGFFDKIGIVVYYLEAIVRLRVREIAAVEFGRILHHAPSCFLGKKTAASSAFIEKVWLFHDVFVWWTRHAAA